VGHPIYVGGDLSLHHRDQTAVIGHGYVVWISMSLPKGERSITRTNGDVLLQRSRDAQAKEKLYVHGGLDSQRHSLFSGALPDLERFARLH
jgi:hypothetical protein